MFLTLACLEEKHLWLANQSSAIFKDCSKILDGHGTIGAINHTFFTMCQDRENECIIRGVISYCHFFCDSSDLSPGLVVVNSNIKLQSPEQLCQGIAVNIGAITWVAVHSRRSKEVFVVDNDSNSSGRLVHFVNCVVVNGIRWRLGSWTPSTKAEQLGISLIIIFWEKNININI